MRRTRLASSKRACAASSRDGVTTAFLSWFLSEVCTGTREIENFEKKESEMALRALRVEIIKSWK
jgi:ferritin